MVEINNQRKAFLDILVIPEGSNGRQKTKIMVMMFMTGNCCSYSDHPRKPPLNRRKSIGAGRYRLTFPLVGCLPQAAWPERLLSEKSGRCAVAAD